jgi:hypothetical protein
MDRRTALPIAVLFVTAVAIACVYAISHWPTKVPSKVVITGSASALALPVSGRAPLEPHVDENSGVLTIAAGDSVASNGVLFGVTNVVAPYTGGGAESRAGELMLINVQIHNSLGSGGEPFSISSASNFELQDESGQVYNSVSVPGAAKPPDGSLRPGETMDGALAYDVPRGLSFRLLFKETLVSQGEIVVDLGPR